MMTRKGKIVKFLITTLFILLPIMDMIRATWIVDVEIFNISIIEFINLLLIGIPFCITIPKMKKKHLKFLGVFFLFVALYIGIHVYNTYKFDISLLPLATHNWLVETYYIIRIYLLPILLIITLFENKDIFNKKYYYGIVKYLIIFISSEIVLLNIFRFSYGTYADELHPYVINNSSFIDIFNTTSGYKKLLTVGLFSSANQISIILFMLLPLNAYNLYLKQDFKSFLLILIQGMAMIIIGTKVAAIGVFAGLLGTMVMYFFFVILKRDKLKKKYLIYQVLSIIILFGILWVSPFRQYYIHRSDLGNYENDMTEEEAMAIRDKVNIEMDTTELVELLTTYQSVFKIDSVFYELYPIENDKYFWVTMALRDRKLNNNYRDLKHNITKRIVARNSNKLDNLFGIGFTSNILDMERDYVYQYYLFGIFGIILLVLIYIFFFVYNILKIFDGKYFNYSFCILLVPAFFGLVACYFSGHLFGWVNPMLILGMTLCIGRVNK